MPGMEKDVSVMMAKNIKLTAFMFKLMEHCSKAYDIRGVNITSSLEPQQQWNLDQKRNKTLGCSWLTNNWAKTMENIVSNLKLKRGVGGTAPAYAVSQHVKFGTYSAWIFGLPEL